MNNKRFNNLNNLKDEELLKKVEELIDAKNNRQRFADSVLGFCSRLIGVKPKPGVDFQLSLKRELLKKHPAYIEKEVESRDNLVLKLTTIRRFITMKNIKRFGLVGVPALAIILALVFTVVNPKLQMARAMEIAKNDPQIQQLIEDYGVEIKQVKLQDGKAFVLLALSEDKLPPELKKRALGGKETADVRGPGQMFMVYQDIKTGKIIEFSGSVAEIDLKAKKVAKLKMVETMKFHMSLTEAEKSRAIEIAKTEPKIQEMIPDLEQREVIVKPLPPLKLRLDEDLDNGMEVTSADPNEQKRANVIFKSDEYTDIITVNLTTNKVEGAAGFGTVEEKTLEDRKKELREGYPYLIKPEIYPDRIIRSLPDEGVIEMHEGVKPDEGLSGHGSATEKEMFTAILKEIAEKDDRIKDLLEDNDYEILEVIMSKPLTTQTETSIETRVETATVVLEKESTGEDYWITIDLGTNTAKSIKSE